MAADFAKAMKSRFSMSMGRAVCAGIALWQKQAHAVLRGKFMELHMELWMACRAGGHNQFTLSRILAA
jgi:hypothetical protein